MASATSNWRRSVELKVPKAGRAGSRIWILRGGRVGYYAGWEEGRESRRNPRVSHSGSGIRTPGRGEFGEIAVPLRRELLARIDDSVSAPSDGHVYRPRDLYHGCGLPGTLTRKL